MNTQLEILHQLQAIHQAAMRTDRAACAYHIELCDRRESGDKSVTLDDVLRAAEHTERTYQERAVAFQAIEMHKVKMLAVIMEQEQTS